MIVYCQLDHTEHILLEICKFPFKEIHIKILHKNYRHLVSASFVNPLRSRPDIRQIYVDVHMGAGRQRQYVFLTYWTRNTHEKQHRRKETE